MPPPRDSATTKASRLWRFIWLKCVHFEPQKRPSVVMLAVRQRGNFGSHVNEDVRRRSIWRWSGRGVGEGRGDEPVASSCHCRSQQHSGQYETKGHLRNAVSSVLGIQMCQPTSPRGVGPRRGRMTGQPWRPWMRHHHLNESFKTLARLSRRNSAPSCSRRASFPCLLSADTLTWEMDKLYTNSRFGYLLSLQKQQE